MMGLDTHAGAAVARDFVAFPSPLATGAGLARGVHGSCAMRRSKCLQGGAALATLRR
jgi:hypothetical protein